MKRYKSFCLLLLLASAGYAQNPSPIDSSYANSHYIQRLAYFRKMPDHRKEIVFLGNSITEQGEWQELLPEKSVINRGISGDVTYGVLARLDEVLSSKPTMIFILIGLNDLKRGIPESIIAKTYSRILNRIEYESPKTKVVVQSVLPVNESVLPSSYQKITNEKIMRLNILIRQIADRLGIEFIDLHPVFSDESGQLKRPLTSDGIHLNAIAYILWTDYLKQKRLFKN